MQIGEISGLGALEAARPEWLAAAGQLRMRTLRAGGAVIAALYSLTDGAACYDFLRGDEPHKPTWGAEPVPRPRLELAH